jgi:hypothetical protein
MRCHPPPESSWYVLATAFYLGLIAWRGMQLLGGGSLAARGLGLGVLPLPIVGAIVTVREVRFGRETQRLGRMMPQDPDGIDDDEPELVRRPSGRVDRAAADAVFAHRRAQVEAARDDWRRWYRLAEAYGEAGDTRRGRQTMRHAIALERHQGMPAVADQSRREPGPPGADLGSAMRRTTESPVNSDASASMISSSQGSPSQ